MRWLQQCLGFRFFQATYSYTSIKEGHSQSIELQNVSAILMQPSMSTCQISSMPDLLSPSMRLSTSSQHVMTDLRLKSRFMKIDTRTDLCFNLDEQWVSDPLFPFCVDFSWERNGGQTHYFHFASISLLGALSIFRASSRLTFDLVAFFEGSLSYPRHTFLERVQFMHCGLASSHLMCLLLQVIQPVLVRCLLL